MKCLRCNSEMKHYDVDARINIKGARHQKTPFPSTIDQYYYSPHSVYICRECGYMEFSMKDCEESDI